VRLPNAQPLRTELLHRGFVLLTEALDDSERTALFDVALALVHRHAVAVDRQGDDQRLCYDVVTGDRIKAEGLPLYGFYTEPEMLSWIRELTASPSLAPSPHLRSAININCLHSAGQQYPWHRDAVPFTGVLFLSSVPALAGGAFVMRAADGELVSVQPTAGTLVFMDGARCPHAVSPLVADRLRLTVPMVYPDRSVERPAGLDQYLYGPA
jgi:hypothetical protein